MVRATFFDAELERALDRDGYAVVPLLDDDAVGELTELYWRIGPAPGDPRMTIHFDFQSPSAEYKQAVSDLTRPILEPKVASLLDRFHLFSPSFIMKWPGGRSGFAPHQDSTLVDEQRFRSVTIWCPLTDTTGADGQDNGILRFVPGSHEFVRWIRAHDPGAFAFDGLEQDIVDHFGVALPLRAGEAVLFDHRTVHFSMPNDSQDSRLVVAMGLRPAEADLLHFRRDPEVDADGREWFDVYEIDDDYFIQLSPFSVREGVPGYQQIDRVSMHRPSVSAAEFERMCRSVAPDVQRDEAIAGRRVLADPFCFRCGTVTGLVDDPGRLEHGNHQLLCHDCATTMSPVS
jgi:hypothetical protein